MKKKKIIIIVGIIIVVLVIIGLKTGVKDSARVRNNMEPKYTLKILSDGGEKITYWGLGYKVVRYPGISPNEPFKNSLGSKFGSWFMSYSKDEATKKYYEATKKYYEKFQQVNNGIVSFKVKENTITSTGATFVMKNNSDKDTYEYGNPFYIEIKKNNEWKKLETINDLNFTLPAFALKPGEDKEFNINWEYGYGKLKAGTYRLVKDVFRSGDEPIDESETIYLYAEFDIK